jgi:iron(III) transport system substrate-binding protein
MAGKLLLATLLIAVPILSARAAEPWQEQWSKTLAAARTEGVVVVSGPPGSVQRQVITGLWAKDFPGIRLDYVGARGTQMISKVVRERASGLFNWDIVLASTDPTVFSLLPIDALAPLRDALIKPELADDRTWIDGFDAGFMDRAKKYFYSARGTGAQPIGYANRECVPREIFSRTADMNRPELAGKIVWFDPTRPSTGSRGTWVVSKSQGEGWLEDLFKNHGVTFSRDYRQMTDWLVHCVKPIAIGMPPDTLEQMQEQGIGAQVESLQGKDYTGEPLPGGSGGNESIGWYNKAPHPNAAKIFVNWYLSRELQEAYVRAVKNNSRRLDTEPGDPEHAMDPNTRYFSWSNEDATIQIKALQARIKQWGVLP